MSSRKTLAGSTSPAEGRTVLALVAGYQGTFATNNTYVEVWDGISWSRTGSLSDGRRDFQMAKLPDGRVMAAGGTKFNSFGASVGTVPQNATEIWSPGNGTWQSYGGMVVGARGFSRSNFKMVALEDNRVLAAGGSYYGSLQHPVNGTATAEVWSPATGLWSETGSMASKRPGEFQMLLLQDGKVLVVGGSSTDDLPAGTTEITAEVYDPSTGAFTGTGSMAVARIGEFAVSLLADGRVMAAGGGSYDSEIWDPVSGVWSNGGLMATTGFQLSMVAIEGGKGLFATGGDSPTFSLTEMWKPEGNGTWTNSSTLKTTGFHRQTGLLADGRVLIVGTPTHVSGGAANLVNATAAALTYDPVTGTSSLAGSLTAVIIVSDLRNVTSYSGEFELVTL